VVRHRRRGTFDRLSAGHLIGHRADRHVGGRILGWVVPLLDWLEHTPLAASIAESDWAFSAIETVHVIALALVVGTVCVVDLRLLG
jgi:hypothetical protein